MARPAESNLRPLEPQGLLSHGLEPVAELGPVGLGQVRVVRGLVAAPANRLGRLHKDIDTATIAAVPEMKEG